MEKSLKMEKAKEEYEYAQKIKEKNYDKYIMKMTTSADEGWAEAIKELEDEYTNCLSRLMSQNYATTLKFYEGRENPYSLYALGVYYHYVNINFDKAIPIYRKLVEENFGLAFNTLGYMYLLGQGVDVDYKIAVKYFKMTKHGYNNLGYMYQKGFGVKLNLDKAIKYYKLAIENGNFVGISNLRCLYKTYSPPDDNEVIDYFIKIGYKHELKHIFSFDNLLDIILKQKKENQEMKNHILASPEGPLYFEALAAWKRDMDVL